MKVGLVLSVVLWGIIIIVVSGCAGMEVGGRLGVYRVDERQESQKTYNKPLKCIFMNCDSSGEAS